MRPDYCPLAGEPCQSLCDKPCSAKNLKINPQQSEPVHDLYDEGFRRGLEISSSYKEEAKAYKEAYFNLVKNVASMKAFEPTPPIFLYTPPQQQAEPVAWTGYDLEGMVEAFSRVIEAHHSSKHPFHNPVDMDAKMALRILRGFIPAMKAYAAPPQRKPLTDELEAAFKDGWQSAKAAHGIKEGT